MRDWMSQDGERSAVPAPTCSAGLAQDGGTRPTPPRKPNSLGEGRRQKEGAPRQGPPKLSLPTRLGWTMAPGCTVMGTAPHASSRHPAGHGPRSQRHPPRQDGEGGPTGVGRGPGPAPSPPQQEKAGWLASPSERGWRGCGLCLPPQCLGQQEMGMPAGPPSPPTPTGESWRS